MYLYLASYFTLQILKGCFIINNTWRVYSSGLVKAQTLQQDKAPSVIVFTEKSLTHNYYTSIRNTVLTGLQGNIHLKTQENLFKGEFRSHVRSHFIPKKRIEYNRTTSFVWKNVWVCWEFINYFTNILFHKNKMKKNVIIQNCHAIHYWIKKVRYKSNGGWGKKS